MKKVEIKKPKYYKANLFIILLRFIYKILKKFAKMAGFDFRASKIIKKAVPDNYEKIFSHANYAPWILDRPFNDVYEIIKAHTFVDKYRCYELWQLIEESTKLSGALIEVGVWRGGPGP